ncbi:MAG: T9SS type A sorting domain-containing protein [Bacteroidia bacterium]
MAEHKACVTISLMTISGKVMMQTKILEKEKAMLSVKTLPSGCYMLRVELGEQVLVQAFYQGVKWRKAGNSLRQNGYLAVQGQSVHRCLPCG